MQKSGLIGFTALASIRWHPQRLILCAFDLHLNGKDPAQCAVAGAKG
jgi:hypothetical protein